MAHDYNGFYTQEQVESLNLNKENYYGIQVEGSLEIFEAKTLNEVKEIMEDYGEELNPENFWVVWDKQEISDFDLVHYTKNDLIRKKGAPNKIEEEYEDDVDEFGYDPYTGSYEMDC